MSVRSALQGRAKWRCSHFFASCLCLLLAACGEVWNDPYPVSQRGANILYSAFSERPKHLDPAVAYAEDEYEFIAQIYEAPLQYHYLKRPYTLIPQTLTEVPKARVFDAAGSELPADADASVVARSVYELKIRPGIRFAPHPAFNGKLPSVEAISRALTPFDLGPAATRELTADDYLYAIKRLVHPRLHSPIAGMMGERIVGLKELEDALKKAAQADGVAKAWLDLDRFPLAGVDKVDAHTLRISLHGKYPQFLYWLAMPFFAPVPREVERFYAQPGMAERNLTLDWFPVGTGPYMLSENNPNSRMVLTRNPHFRGEAYPSEGEVGDAEAGLLVDAGKPMPFVDTAIFTREKESIPYWSKFLQGFYDASGISSDSFDQAVRVGSGGDVTLTDEMRAKGIRLLTSVRASSYYMGFNMIDPVVGGLDDKRRKLRQAISIAIDQEEFIAIFMNGRGVPAMGPLPPGIFGYIEGQGSINPVVYDWQGGTPGDAARGKPVRKSVERARQLIAEAGYPNGRHAVTGEALVINLDTTSGGMGEKSRLDWLTRQFSQIGIQLVVRSTDFNRFQEKLRKGAVQLYYLGWNADYPDPENFLFLLNGAEGKVAKGGENASNYANPEFDRLFERMKNMESDGPRGAERLAIIRQAIALLQKDAPWIFGFHPKSYTLSHAWLFNRKPNDVGHNTLKYQRIDVAARERQRIEWNRPVLWPLLAGALLLVSVVWPAVAGYRRRENGTARDTARGTARP